MKETMPQLSPEKIWRLGEKELLSLLDAGKLVPKPNVIRFYAPSFMYYRTSYCRSSPADFPTVSLTGTTCALNCGHCGGKVLETMTPAETPEKLFEVAVKLKQNGALGFLVSGGCLPDGSVLFHDFIPTLGRIKRELSLTVFVHTGIVDSATASALKSAGVDAALIDIIGSDETIRQSCNLNVSVKDYESSLKALEQAGLNFVPHVIVGLHGGKLRGEYAALNMIRSCRPSAIVIIAFMPIRGTAMEGVKPPLPTDIARVIATARLMFIDAPLVLGCMRPKGKHRVETDMLALKAGVDAIAFPSEEAVTYAETHGCKALFSSYCCAQIYVDAVRKS